MLVAAVLAIAYLILEPASADHAAQTFRSDLFASHGFLLWNNDWYGGHYLPGYSVLFPPLGAALGPRLAGALAAVAAAGLFGALARHAYGDRARLATLWFGAGIGATLFTGRLTFVLGIAIGLGALLALQRRRPVLAGGLAVLTVCGSPVAGLFLGLAGVAVMLAGDRRGGALVAFPAFAALGALSLAFPTGGAEPFVFSAFVGVPLLAAGALFLLPTSERELRWGVAVYTIAATAAFVLANPVGGNMARLGALAGGPVLALALAGRRPLARAAVALPLLYWQWVAPVRDVSEAAGDPSVHSSYYEPLLAELERRTRGRPARVEIPPTGNRWEAGYVAPRFPLARGWLRQLESDDRDLFTDGNLTAAEYRRWLDREGVSYVAVADAQLDYLAADEEDLIRRGLPYLRAVWSDEHWRLYRVEGDAGLVDREGPRRTVQDGRITALGPAGFTIVARDSGALLVRVRYSRYWTVTAGEACVERHGDWTEVQVIRPGTVSVAARFSLDGLLGRDRQCSA
ncbi:MAG TPA: hypothetical protein VLA62_00830 [Solirubrobacterales bacterium]|nr:hypothetical protein [Solirubrobacterales bacterium]